MPRKPFSFLDPPLTQPYAAGEDNRHLPAMPLLSGQDAINSLVGYYPSARKMDRLVNPHTYQRPEGTRMTTMPNTKVALLLKTARDKRRRDFLATLDPAKSLLVSGFLVKCSNAKYDEDATLTACFQAASLHPAIAMEFEKCGFTKEAENWFGRGMSNAGNFLKGLGTSLAGGVGRVAGGIGQLGGRATDAVGLTSNATGTADAFANEMQAATQSGLATAFGGLTDQDPSQVAKSWSKTPGYERTQSVPEMRQRHLRQLHAGGNGGVAGGAYTTLNAIGDTAMEMVPTAGASALPGAASLGKALPAAAQYGKGLQKTMLGIQGLNSPVGEAAFGTALPALRDASSLGDAAGRTIGGLSDYQQGAINPGQAVGFVGHTGTPDGEMLVQLHDGRQVPEGQVNAATGLGPQAPPDRVEQFNAQQAGQSAPAPTNQAQLDKQRMKTPPPAQANAAQPAAPSQPATPQPGQQQAAAGEPQQPKSWTDYVPYWSQIQGLVQQAPEQAKEFYDQASTHIKAAFGNEAAQAELANVAKGGDLSPAAQQDVAKKVMQETGDEKTTMGILGNMGGWEKLALFGGLGLGALGLVQAMSGDGGIGGWLMTILGLGAAGFAAGNAGLLGEGAQQLTQGIGEQAGNMTSGLFGPGESGEQKSPLAGGADSFMKKYGPTALKWMPDSLSTPALKYLAEQNPELASKLDMATGNSNVVGNLLGFGGGLTGYTDNALAQYGFKTPEQQEDLFRRWSLMRQSGAQ